MGVQKLADVNVTLHDVVASVVESAGQSWLEQHFRETFGANNDDVFVWEHAGILLVNSAVDLSSVS